MLRMKKLLFAVTLCAVTIGVFPSTCYGNSAEPPSIVIIVPDAPDDLKILVKSNNTYIEAKRTNNIIETLYSFYSIDLNTVMDYTIKVNTGGKTFEILLEEPANTYRDILTLNLNSQTLTPGKSLKRSFFLISLRMILTLFIEATVFWLFGFRRKSSWIVFFIINLVTQGLLNVMLNGSSPINGYLIAALILGEIFVFMIEIITFLIFINEHRRIRTFFYVIAANLLSLLAGGYIITVLPV